MSIAIKKIEAVLNAAKGGNSVSTHTLKRVQEWLDSLTDEDSTPSQRVTLQRELDDLLDEDHPDPDERPVAITEHWSHRFWDSIEKADDPDGCWLWTGSKRNGYGTLNVNGTVEYAHRIALLLEHGRMPPQGEVTRHRCPGGANRACVAPHHLSWGSRRLNMFDTLNDGTVRSDTGEAMRKLSDDDVADIRARYARGGITQRELGEQYGVTQSCISYAIRKGFHHVHVAYPSDEEHAHNTGGRADL